MVTIRGGSFTNEDLRQAKELADTVAQNTASNLGQDSRARRQEFLLNRYTPDNRPQVQVAARGLLGGYDPDFGEEMGTEVFSPQGVANTVPIVNMPSLDPGEAAAQIYRETGPSLAPQGIASMFPDPTGGYATRGDPRESFAARDVAIDEIANMNPLVKGIHNVYARMFGLGTDDQGNITPEALIDLKRQTQQTMARDQELGDERRKDQERAERAAMLAAQQQQPIDPCPEGYRMDPVSKVCVPVDDTTEPEETTPRTYDTMTEPVADYTAKTDFTVPTVTLPDILTYG